MKTPKTLGNLKLTLTSCWIDGPPIYGPRFACGRLGCMSVERRVHVEPRALNRNEMTLLLVSRSENEWQRRLSQEEIARLRHLLDVSSAKKNRIKDALDHAMIQLRDRRREVDLTKEKLAAMTER